METDRITGLALLPTPAAAREYLANSPRAWPYLMAANYAHAGLSQMAAAYGMDTESFARLCTAAREKIDAAAGKRATAGLAAA